MARLLVDIYAEPASGVPRQILVPTVPADLAAVSEYLADRRGGPVAVKVPLRGPKAALLETVHRNAGDAFVRHRLQRTSDHNSRARALEALQRELRLPVAPLRIECYDMSHLQGTDYVGSMVVFEDGLPKKSDYRHFKVATVAGNDDYAAMEEVLTPSAHRPPRRGGPGPRAVRSGRRCRPDRRRRRPGGRGHTSAVRLPAAAPADRRWTGSAPRGHPGARPTRAHGTDPVASLAKSFEEVYLPDSSVPVRLPRTSEALYLLQRLRDEAHRFAISYHRTLRGKRMTVGALDGVKGLGPKRRSRLVEQFGGLGELRKATRDELMGLSWLPAEVGAAVFERLHTPLSPER